MNHEHFTQRLAEYLGDEMNAGERRRFEQALADDPALAEEAAGLGAALRAMRSLNEVAPAPQQPAHAGSGWRARMPVVMRYAAAIALAFMAGYFIRPAPPPPSTAPAADADAVLVRLAQAYVRQPGDSSLARSLLAVSRLNAADHAQ